MTKKSAKQSKAVRLKEDQKRLTAFNRQVQSILVHMIERDIRTKTGHNFDRLCQLFEDRKIVIGADSACFHILLEDGDVLDCNPNG